MGKPTIQDLTRRPLVLGTMCFTDPEGQVGYKTDQLQASALVRIADALEKRNEMDQFGRCLVQLQADNEQIRQQLEEAKTLLHKLLGEELPHRPAAGADSIR